MSPPIDLATELAPSPTRSALSGRATTADPVEQHALLLLVRIGKRRFAIPAAAIIRILPMAESSTLPEAPPGTVGVLAFQGALLPVVDPRPRLGLPTLPPQVDQHLVAIAAQTRYLLWVDRAEAIVTAAATAGASDLGTAASVFTPQFVRVADEYLPVLSASTFDPGSRVSAIDARPE